MNTMPSKEAGNEPSQRRRRRKDKGEVIGRRLGVNKSMLDFKKFAYRWINDDPARIMAKTKEDDWDIVTNQGGVVKEDSADLGAAVTQVVGTFANGEPKLAYLCRKPIKFYQEDQAEKQKELDKQLTELRRGADRDGKPNADYIPHSGIKM